MSAQLLNCPWCGAPLFIRAGVNPYGRCETKHCWMASRKICVPLHDPTQVAEWNTRAPNSAAEGLAMALEAIAERCNTAVYDSDDDTSGVAVRVKHLRAARDALAAYRAGQPS